MKLKLSAGLVAGLVAVSAAPAAAAPVTVNLRIEGPTKTLFEGPVTTDVRPFHFNGDVDHTCDTSPPAGSGTVPAVSRGAVVTAAEALGLQAGGSWSDAFGSPSFTQINGENVAYDPGTTAYLGEFLNGQSSSTGACGEAVSNGDQVLFAYGTYGEPLLALSGPAKTAPGATATLKVTDATTGAPVAGAAVAGATSAADGTVTVGPLSAGSHLEKATKDGAVRSNAVDVCVTNGNDGQCGTSVHPVCPQSGGTGCPGPVAIVPDRTPPVAKLAGIADHAVLKTGPRLLSGSFSDPSAVKAVKLRLTKRVGSKCWYFSGRSEAFRGTKCGTGPYFSIDAKNDWSYLLPARLGKGRYVLDAIAIDAAGNRTPLARGATRVVFTVR